MKGRHPCSTTPLPPPAAGADDCSQPSPCSRSRPSLLATPGAADAATTHDRADAAGGWLGRQLDADTHVMVGQFGADYGLTADVVLALDSAKVGKAAARRATRALSTHVLAYTGGGDATEFYAGSFAKLIVVAAAQGVDPTAFGTGPRKDLVANLRALECGTRTRTDCPAGTAGRFSDRSQFGDFSNPITQSLAVIALERATRRGASRNAVSYLLGEQCANGAFPEKFGTTACAPSVDATGFAVQALTRLNTPKADAAATAAGRWLKRHQHANGSFTGNGTRNANTTGARGPGADRGRPHQGRRQGAALPAQPAGALWRQAGRPRPDPVRPGQHR